MLARLEGTRSNDAPIAFAGDRSGAERLAGAPQGDTGAGSAEPVDAERAVGKHLDARYRRRRHRSRLPCGERVTGVRGGGPTVRGMGRKHDMPRLAAIPAERAAADQGHGAGLRHVAGQCSVGGADHRADREQTHAEHYQTPRAHHE